MINIINKIINKNKYYEDKLLKKYGFANELKKYNLKILFITDTHDCLSYDEEWLNMLKNMRDYDYIDCYF